MAVYTALERDALVEWLVPRDVGTLIDFRGIESGIENTNFFVTTRAAGRDRHFVLTLFERLDAQHLPYYLSLMEHLASRGLPCPAPMPDRDGTLFSMLAGKPAALVTRLEGRSVAHPDPAHCAAIGTMLARLHAAGCDFAATQTNPRGIDWWIQTSRHVRAHLDDERRALLDDECALQSTHWAPVTQGLPRGAIHADLFRDNALFVDGASTATLGGVIDFYFAGDDVWLLDIAICINDWCVDLASGDLHLPRMRALIDAYEAVRPLTDDEHRALPQVLRAAALRFWLSRLDDLHRPRPAQLLVPHDPTRFERLLRKRRADAMQVAQSRSRARH